MGKGLALGFALLLAGLGILHAQSVLGFPPGAFRARGALDPIPIISGSVWGDHGTTNTLSTTAIANDTVNNTVNDFSGVRGTQAYSSGKHYFEVKVLSAPLVANFFIGIMDNTTANGAPMDSVQDINASCTNLQFNGQHDGTGAGYNGTNIGSSWALANGDVMAVAVDHDNGFSYLALNNVWFLSGDPTSTGTGAVCNGSLAAARPALILWGGTSFGGIHQLITTTGAFTYTVPTGYSAWN